MRNSHRRISRTGLKRLPGAFALRLPLAVLVFLSLMVQSFVVQSHIHIPQATGKAQTVSLVTLAAVALAEKPHAAGDICAEAPRDKYPISEDPTNCPLCQEVAHSGEYVPNAAFSARLPFAVTFHYIPYDAALPSFLTVAHVWHGRAPPLA